jgi:hypothetical protein
MTPQLTEVEVKEILADPFYGFTEGTYYMGSLPFPCTDAFAEDKYPAPRRTTRQRTFYLRVRVRMQGLVHYFARPTEPLQKDGYSRHINMAIPELADTVGA